MQTFKSQSNHADSKGDYVPYVPEALDEKRQSSQESIETRSQNKEVMFHDTRETYTQHLYQPEYTYIPPTSATFTREHWGMSREKFRTLILALFGLTFVIFLIIIIGFGGRDATYRAPRIPELNLVHPTPRQKIQFPLLVSGQAQTSWFFEGAFPVTLYDKNNIPVARDFARTNKDPLAATVPLLPFELTFKVFDYLPTPGKGYMVLQKGTGEGTTDGSGIVTIPIRFPRTKEGDIILKDQVLTTPTIGTTPNNTYPDQDPTGIGTASFECSDEKDNDVDGYTDELDNDCHADLRANTPEGYDPYANENGRGSGGYNPSTTSDYDSGWNTSSDPISYPATQPTTVSGDYLYADSKTVTLYLPVTNTAYSSSSSCNSFYGVNRTVDTENSLEKTVHTTLTYLINAPTNSERTNGYGNALASNLDIDSISLRNGVASVYFSNNSITRGTCTRIEAVLEIEKTLLQFDEITSVRVYANGVRQ